MRHQRHQLDRLTLLRGRTNDTNNLTVAFSDKDNLELDVHVARFHTTVASEEGVNPTVVHSFEVVTRLRQDESSRTVSMLTLVKRNHRDVRRVEPRLVNELLVQHVLIDTNLVVVLRRASDAEALPDEEFQRLFVRFCHSAVDLPSTMASGEIFGVLEQHTSDAHLSSVRRVNNERADLDSPLFLVDNMNDTHGLSITLGDEHVLSDRELADVVNTACHVRIKDTPCVCVVVAVIKRCERPDHKIRDEIEIVRPCRAYDDVIDQHFSHSTPSCNGYDF